MNRNVTGAVLLLFGSLLSRPAAPEEPLRMVRLHTEWSWTGDNHQNFRVAKSDLAWAKDDADFPKHALRSVTLFQDQGGHRWILESRREGGPDRFVLSLQLLESGETVTVSMVQQDGKNLFRVQGLTVEFAVEEGQEGTPTAENRRRDLFARLSPAFRSAFSDVQPWIEKGYLGVNAASFLRYAFDLSAPDRLSTLSQEVFHPLRPAPVDCAFDASFGFPCSPEETPKDSRGFLYEKASPRVTP
ncbi:MAG: hypothetical protein ACP5VN_05195 [Acidobacteriota bacterium]